MPDAGNVPGPETIRKAAERISGTVHRTPVMTSSAINAMCGATLFFKCENFQKVGAFKFRGATNVVLSLTDKEALRGVCTHSSGNHAAALALAASQRGIPAYIVMPKNSPDIKKRAVLGYGANITYCEPTLEAREETLRVVREKTGAYEVHPYNDYRIIAGQATAALELIEDIPELDIVMTPVGGGGLLAGTALAVKYFSPSTKVIAAEPAGADDAFRSYYSKSLIPSVEPKTVADGLLTSLGEKNFSIILQHVDGIITVSEEIIIQAMRHVWERMKIIIEPSAAVTLATILEQQIEAKGKRIGLILSGGNVDLDHPPWMKR